MYEPAGAGNSSTALRGQGAGVSSGWLRGQPESYTRRGSCDAQLPQKESAQNPARASLGRAGLRNAVPPLSTTQDYPALLPPKLFFGAVTPSKSISPLNLNQHTRLHENRTVNTVTVIRFSHP